MASDTDTLLIAGAVIAGLYIYNDVKGGLKGLFGTPTTSLDELERTLPKAGYVLKTDQFGQRAIEVPGGVVYPPEQSNLRRFEKGIVFADRFVPGTWLSRGVFL